MSQDAFSYTQLKKLDDILDRLNAIESNNLKENAEDREKLIFSAKNELLEFIKYINEIPEKMLTGVEAMRAGIKNSV